MSLPLGIGGQSTEHQTLQGYRDAFHVGGVICKTTTQNLQARDYVRFTNRALESGRFDEVFGVKTYEEAHGIVDPFLAIDPWYGAVFWVWIRPELVGQLKHHWIIGLSADDADKDEEIYSDCDIRGCNS